MHEEFDLSEKIRDVEGFNYGEKGIPVKNVKEFIEILKKEIKENPYIKGKGMCKLIINQRAGNKLTGEMKNETNKC
ncbi:MAG: hypothetical protein ACOC1X_01835 [Promethearchaeota archaeon]